MKGGVLSYKHDNTIYTVGMGNNGTYKQKDLDQTARSNTQATLWMTDFFVGLCCSQIAPLAQYVRNVSILSSITKAQVVAAPALRSAAKVAM